MGREPPGRRWLVATALLAGALAGWREDAAVLAAGLAVFGVLRARTMTATRLVTGGIVAGFLPWMAVAAQRGEAAAFAAHVGRRLLFLVERLAIPTHAPWRAPKRLPETPTELGLAVFPLLAALPVVVYGALIFAQLWRARTGRATPLVVGAALAGCAFLPQFLWERADLGHFRNHLPVLLAVTALVSSTFTLRRQRQVAAALVVLALIGAGAVALERIGATPRALPPWAGLEHRAGETMIVTFWRPGWYVLEDLEPGTRFPLDLRAPPADP